MTDCQRWRDHQPSWRHTSEGGFNKRLYEVAAIPDDTTAARFVVAHHYSRKYVAAIHRFGLYRGERLEGVAVFSGGSNAKTLSKPLPDLKEYRESVELGRLVLLDEVPANAESYFVARAFEELAKVGIGGVVSFSDPQPRTDADGRVVMPGHIGIVYQALNAVYLGRGTPRSLWTKDQVVLDARSLQKIRAHEKGWAGAVDDLIALGARPLQASEDPRAWLREAKTAAGITVKRHPGNHRYAWRLGKPRKYWTFGIASQPYPKRRAM